MSQAATKDDLRKLGSNLRETIKEGTRDVISHFNQSQGKQTEWIKQEFAEVNTKLNAIMSGEVLVTRPQIKRLIRALKAKGIELDEAEIFAS